MEAKTISLRISSHEAAQIETLAHELRLTQSDVLKQGLVALQEKLRTSARPTTSVRICSAFTAAGAATGLRGRGACKVGSSIAVR